MAHLDDCLSLRSRLAFLEGVGTNHASPLTSHLMKRGSSVKTPSWIHTSHFVPG